MLRIGNAGKVGDFLDRLGGVREEVTRPIQPSPSDVLTRRAPDGGTKQPIQMGLRRSHGAREHTDLDPVGKVQIDVGHRASDDRVPVGRIAGFRHLDWHEPPQDVP